MNVWTLAARNITRNLRRSLLTGGVVVFGFAAFALAGGFMAQSLIGLRDGTIRSGMGHLQFAAVGAFAPGADADPEHALHEADRVEAVLRRHPQVVEVLPRIDFTGLISDGRRTVPHLGVGLDPGREARCMDTPTALAAGRWLAGPDEPAVVLGTGLAASLAAGLGDTVTLLATTRDGTLNAVDATVVGLANLPIKELDDRFVATSIDLAATLLDAPDTVSKLVVVLRDTSTARGVLAELEQELRGLGIAVDGRSWEDLAPFYHQVRLLYIGIFGFMGIVLVAVVLLASANTMTMAVTERTREIGTLRALGTRTGFIRRLFLAEAVLLGAAGCVAGALLSLLIRFFLNHSGIMLPPPPGATRGWPLHVRFYATAYLAGALAMLVTLALASWLPARRAARLRIVEALTHV